MTRLVRACAMGAALVFAITTGMFGWVPAPGQALRGPSLVSLFAVASAQGDTVPDGWQRVEIHTPEGARSVLVYAPEGPERRPLVVVLHGNGGSGAGIASLTGFVELASREGFVVAFPDGPSGTWNYVQGIPGYPTEPDDAAALLAVTAALEAASGTDPDRRYVVGYSNGGFMAQRLACVAPHAFAGFVSVAAGGFAGLDALCPGDAAVSIALVHGTADTNVPWGGLPVEVPGGTVHLTWPIPTTFAWWAERAACSPPALRSVLPGDPELGVDEVIVFTLASCAGERTVALFGLRGGGHAWPAGEAFDAAEAAWRFLRDQRAP